MFFDLDCFKVINDIFGYWVGDLLFIVVVKRFERIVILNMKFVWLVGDEFIIFIENYKKKLDV